MRTISGFSLIELLIAMAVLGIVAAIIIPRYTNLQDQVTNTTALAIADELNHVYANWNASGGTVTGVAPTTAGLLAVLSSPNAVNAANPIVSGDSNIYDGGTSNNMRFSPPSGMVLPSGTDTSVAIGFNGMFITFNPISGMFTGQSQTSAIASGNPPASYSQNGIDYTWSNGAYGATRPPVRNPIHLPL